MKHKSYSKSPKTEINELQYAVTDTLQSVIDAESHDNKQDRIVHHWLGMRPSDHEWELNEAIGRVVFGALPAFISQSGFVVHGVFGDQENQPTVEVIKGKDKDIVIPKIAVFFLESTENKQRLLIGGEVGILNKWKVHILGKNSANWLEKLRHYILENNYLRGNCFDLKGHLLLCENVHLSDVILTESQEKIVENHILKFIRNINKIGALGGSLKRGILLEGEPGCGKSMLLKALINELEDISICYVGPGSITEIEDIETLLKMVELTKPCVVMLEEIDLLGCDRLITHSTLLGELMQAMDGLKTAQGVLWIATTNRIEVVESALANRPGRFDRHIKFGPLLCDKRKELLYKNIKDIELSSEARMLLHEKTEGLTGAEVAELIQTLRLFCIERGDDAKIIDNDAIECAIRDCGFAYKSNFGFGKKT